MQCQYFAHFRLPELPMKYQQPCKGVDKSLTPLLQLHGHCKLFMCVFLFSFIYTLLIPPFSDRLSQSIHVEVDLGQKSIVVSCCLLHHSCQMRFSDLHLLFLRALQSFNCLHFTETHHVPLVSTQGSFVSFLVSRCVYRHVIANIPCYLST